MPTPLRTHIYIAGTADITFLSQIAFFDRALRLLYGSCPHIRVRCFLGGAAIDQRRLPAHIAHCLQKESFAMIDVICDAHISSARRSSLREDRRGGSRKSRSLDRNRRDIAQHGLSQQAQR
jgi:hypothetical protein